MRVENQKGWILGDRKRLANPTAIELLIRWGNSVIHLAELNPPRSFYVGETAGPHACDCFLPSEILGTERWPLLLVEGTELACVVHPNAVGSLSVDGEDVDLDTVPADGGWIEWPGARRIILREGMRVHLELGSVVVDLALGRAEPRMARHVGSLADGTTAAYFGLSLAAHAGLIAAFAFFTPGLGLTEDEDLDQRRMYLMQQYLEAAAEREKVQEQAPATDDTLNEEGGTGRRSQGEEGAMGKPVSQQSNRRYAIKGNAAPQDQQLSRHAALEEAATFGMITLLRGDPNAPTAPWGRDFALGSDALSAQGSMWGKDLGEAFGAGGLGLSGIGESSGGRGEGIGLGDIGGPFGHGAGIGTGLGFGPGNGGIGNSVGRSNGTHQARAPRMRPGTLTLSGRLPPEVIQRVVRQNFGRFRLCYQQGLTRNPNLEGRVSARFVIDRSGAVTNVANGGSDLPDSAVVSCVISAFYGLSFPQPENGIVTVVYPIVLAPG
jgi:hypothetical protein